MYVKGDNNDDANRKWSGTVVGLESNNFITPYFIEEVSVKKLSKGMGYSLRGSIVENGRWVPKNITSFEKSLIFSWPSLGLVNTGYYAINTSRVPDRIYRKAPASGNINTTYVGYDCGTVVPMPDYPRFSAAIFQWDFWNKRYYGMSEAIARILDRAAISVALNKNTAITLSPFYDGLAIWHRGAIVGELVNPSNSSIELNKKFIPFREELVDVGLEVHIND